MKFSESTIDILKNFSTINQSVGFKEGNVLRTISPYKTIMATATLKDDIPGEAYVYDLSKFLSVYSLFEDPDVEFGERQFTIQENRRKNQFTYADKSMIMLPPEKDISLPSVDVEIDLEWSDIESVIKAAGVLQLPEIALIGEEGKVFLRAVDAEKGNKDTYGVDVGVTAKEFKFVFKRDNLKLLEGAYKVKVNSKGISEFKSDLVTYFVAIEAKLSKFDG